MIKKVLSPISVELFYDHNIKKSSPRQVFWHGRQFPITRLGLHHTFYQGKTLFHIFSVQSHSLALRLKLNTENMAWTLEEISDGQVN